MATSMRKFVQLVHREALKCRLVVSSLRSFPSHLQQRISSTSSGPASAAPLVEGSQLQGYVVPSYLSGILPCGYGKQGQYITIHPFAIRVCSAGSRFFSSDTSVSSTPSSKEIKIPTKLEDKGESSLYDGQRRRKDDPTFEALGDLDELNSVLGLAHEYCSQSQLISNLEQIEEIQSRLLDIGSAVAAPLKNLSSKKVARIKFNAATVEVLENWIDKMNDELPHLTQFILPSGGLPAASLHVARSICRRAERKLVILVEEQVVDQSVVRYLNRLSDYLFTAARYAAFKLDKPATLWRINNR